MDDDVIVALTYGPSADWARNVLAAGGSIENRHGRREITNAEIVDRSVAWPCLPLVVRGALRVLRVRDFLKLTLFVRRDLVSFGLCAEPERQI